MNSTKLNGIKGNTLMGFLSALGTLRALSLARPDLHPCLSWTQEGLDWRPIVHLDIPASEDDLVKWVHAAIERLCDLNKMPVCYKAVKQSAFADICRDRKGYRAFSERAVSDYLNNADPLPALWAATFANESTLSDDAKGAGLNVLVLQRGQGHKYLPRTIKSLMDHLAQNPHPLIKQALFGPWTYTQGISGTYLDANILPSPIIGRSAEDEPPACVVGAEVLAFVGMSFYVVHPVGKEAVTTACKDERVYWCLWTQPLGEDEVASVLCQLLDKNDLSPHVVSWVGAVYAADVGVGVSNGLEYYRQVSPSVRVR